jgi:indole-3-glycerol phosphate synthase
MNVYTLPRVPGATETTEWTAFCHSKEPFLVIDYNRFTADYRAERKRPFHVALYYRRSSARFISFITDDHWFSTLAKAQAFAAEISKETP